MSVIVSIFVFIVCASQVLIFFVSRLCCVLIVSSGIQVSICLVMLVALLQAEENFSCFGTCTKVAGVHVYFCQCLICVVSDPEKSTFYDAVSVHIWV